MKHNKRQINVKVVEREHKIFYVTIHKNKYIIYKYTIYISIHVHKTIIEVYTYVFFCFKVNNVCMYLHVQKTNVIQNSI